MFNLSPRTLRTSLVQLGFLGGLVLASTAVLPMQEARAASVSYQVTDLADVTPGEDLWQIDYTISGPLDTFQGINLIYPSEVFGSLALLSNDSPSDLDVAPPIDPDAGLGADGLLSILALANLDASFSGKIGVSVVWLGGGKPGTQTYEVFDENFNVVSTGSTTPAVPEPESLALLLAGLGVAAMAHRKRHRG